MKKIKILILLLLVFQVTYAQVNEKRAGGSKEASSENLSRKITDASGMSDDEIIEYISKQADKGVPGRDIVLYLLKKGVSEERLNAIRDLLNEEKNAKKSKKMNEPVKEDRMRESGELTTGSMIVKKEVEEVIPDSAEISELTGELDKKIEIFGHNLFNKKGNSLGALLIATGLIAVFGVLLIKLFPVILTIVDNIIK
jgi:hypothetical protein